MIELQFIAGTFHMEYKSVAEAIGVSKQTFQDWIKERLKIPEPRLEQLSELFGIEDKFHSNQKLNSAA
ncbi:helix-turn-helix transcriptional regulator [Paenibacillus sp. FSL H7-0756]